MFAPVRARSLKRLVSRVFARWSERERTRANAEPCHSCHGSFDVGTFRRRFIAGAGYGPISDQSIAVESLFESPPERDGVVNPSTSEAQTASRRRTSFVRDHRVVVTRTRIRGGPDD